jgi:hypothetical protein
MLRVAVFAVVLTACVGDVQTGGGTDSNSGGIDASIDAPKLMWVDAAPGSGNGLPCENHVTPSPNGHHNPGKSCFQSCHNHGFTMAGTLYTNATGNTGFAGATITVVDANNVTRKFVTYTNGNFYTNQAMAQPLLVIASSCPSAVKMTLASSDGNCNSCHVGGTSNQMHLP